jgi:hypothetical protein
VEEKKLSNLWREFLNRTCASVEESPKLRGKKTLEEGLSVPKVM